jgi:hypothetical protein
MNPTGLSRIRSLCLSAAVVLVLIANGLGIWQSSRNRAEPAGGVLELTERELPLQRVELESSVTILRLKWKTERQGNDRWGPAAWLTPEKLADLGFDCSVPVDSPRARRHYESMPARRVFLALEYQPPHADAPNPVANRHCGLAVIDAARDPQELRRRHPDSKQVAIARGAVRIRRQERDSEGQPLARPELVGWVDGLMPSQIFVPRPANQFLAALHGTGPEPDQEDSPAPGPRFSARVHWGRNYEPWVDELKAITNSGRAVR